MAKQRSKIDLSNLNSKDLQNVLKAVSQFCSAATTAGCKVKVKKKKAKKSLGVQPVK